jgi:putative DNA methylase
VNIPNTTIRRVPTSSRWEAQLLDKTLELPLSPTNIEKDVLLLDFVPGPRAIEDEAFPFEALSDVAEVESWRKEINRPTTHIHKWWAQRLGTVFRALTIGAFAPSGADVFDLFYKPIRISATIFDPFMGSGTTLAESVKLGAKAIGRDINSVAHFLVKCALSVHDRKSILETFRAIERDVADEISRYYRATLPNGAEADVLYTFWVKTVDCPSCKMSVDLFTSQIFARHAYPKKVPQAQAVCPHCDGINEVHVEARNAQCMCCAKSFDPNAGPAKGQSATCPVCNHTFPIAKTIRASGKPPAHRMYAKLVLLPDGKKTYQAIVDEDRKLFAKAECELALRTNPYPIVAIEPGYNTNQALGYNYRHWHEMFNARQLLCLSMLADRIREIREPVLRDLFTCLFSGALEFNNMFASYKGEGTGAVRHMFAHQIMKPERVPLEAHVWGTAKSSGSFSTMFEGRIRRALDYADDPFELRLNKGGKTEKVRGLSEKIGTPVAKTYRAFANGFRVYLSCGDSGSTDLPDCSVDAVLTDPPFFDNVHYSQLADFFHVWQRHILGTDGVRAADTTRSAREVQNADAGEFTERLAAVWREAHRVLKDDGLLVFTYHHSRPEGWRCVLHALLEASFGISAVHPIKAEMSVAMPKLQAKEPIDLDIIMVCRKRSQLETHCWNGDLLGTVAPPALAQADRLRVSGRRLSRNDVRIIVMAQLLRQISRSSSLEAALHLLDTASVETEALIHRTHAAYGGIPTTQTQSGESNRV